ncbi:MAG: DUF2220 family protein [Gammaproteobacteria bacterium]|nr:DUF2220 family protein [Gammaproteobacteria bacterium]
MNTGSNGEAVATAALVKLEGFGESAVVRGADGPKFYRLGSGRFGGYFKLETLTERHNYERRMIAAETAGAVMLRWAGKPDDGVPLEAVAVADLSKLSKFLGKSPYFQEVETAVAKLASFMDTWPRLVWVIDQWKKRGTARGFTPTDVKDIVDAVRVLEAVQPLPELDLAVRRISVSLFQDSKRIEALAAALDLLTAEEPRSPARSMEEVLNELGLIRFPQPLLIAGPGQLKLKGAQNSVPVLDPFIGISPDALEALTDPGRYLLTVENLTPFNELARGRAGRLEGTVIYVAGMPAPSLLRALGAAYRSLAPGVSCYHWGDLDLGGFRIAARIAAAGPPAGLKLWRMAPSELGLAPGRKVMNKSEIDEINRISQRHGFGVTIGDAQEAIEQESQDVLQP